MLSRASGIYVYVYTETKNWAHNYCTINYIYIYMYYAVNYTDSRKLYEDH